MYSLFLMLLMVITFPLNAHYWNTKKLSQEAVIVVPVADMAAQSLQSLDPHRPVEDIYNSLPFSPETGPYSCCRVHQLVFNDIVTIKQKLGDEVECEVARVFYENDKREHIHTFWTLAKNVKLLTTIKNGLKDLSSIPQPYINEHAMVTNEGVLTLSLPFYSAKTKTTYSVGTRFVRLAHLDTAGHYAVSIIIPEMLTVDSLFIPKDSAFVRYPQTIGASIKTFVEILKRWAYQKSKKVPFVWGGNSFTVAYNPGEGKLIEDIVFGEKVTYWTRSNGSVPCSGFDASNLVLCAAQIAGLPYFFKNTTTLGRHIKTLDNYELLEEGDLIYYKGGVAVVSDIPKNEVIAAFGYSSGYGVVQAKTLSELFENVSNYKQLLDAYKTHSPLKVINAYGVPVRDIPQFSLLKLRSIYS